VRSYVDDAVGFGENPDTTYGTHRVLAVHDPVDDTILNIPSGLHAGRVPIEECVHADHAPVRVTSAGWTLVSTHPVATAAPALGLQPAVDGSPPISASRRIVPGRCVIADLVFVIRDGSVVRSVGFVGKGDENGRWADVGR
jgi:hypothetical protein